VNSARSALNIYQHWIYTTESPQLEDVTNMMCNMTGCVLGESAYFHLPVANCAVQSE
jgi:hypothetical protein